MTTDNDNRSKIDKTVERVNKSANFRTFVLFIPLIAIFIICFIYNISIFIIAVNKTTTGVKALYNVAKIFHFLFSCVHTGAIRDDYLQLSRGKELAVQDSFCKTICLSQSRTKKTSSI